MGSGMPDVSEPQASAGDMADLRSRSAALRHAAKLRGADQRTLLDAALAELDAAIDALAQASGDSTGLASDRTLSDLHSERRLLRAVFADTPVPLYVIDREGTVLRANSAACELLDVGQGYATGRSLTTLVDPAARAALRSQLAAVNRTGENAVVACGVLRATGAVRGELQISPLNVRGDPGRLLVAVTTPGASRQRGPVHRSGGSRPIKSAAPDAAVVATATRRLDMLAAATRLLLESASISESVLLQRCGRLLTQELATWAVIDIRRRDQLRRHFVAGPDDHESVGLAHVAASVDPGPGSVPDQVMESGTAQLITHADDELALGLAPDKVPLLALLGAASVLSVPLADGTRQYGVLTLLRDGDGGQFTVADAALAEDIGGLLARAISARRTLRRRTEAAEALRASLLPPVLKPVPGVDIAYAHMAPTRGREVGGDFYDAYPTPGGWGVAIGDVCGKGEDAAAATASARHAIRVLAHSNADPAGVLRGANDIMLAEDFGGRFVTASAAHLSWDNATLRVVLASAGHPGPVLLKADGRARLLPGGGVALGIFPDPEPTTLELELSTGDALFFFTDGLADVRSQQTDYVEDHLADSLAPLAGRHAAELVSEIRKLVLEFSGGVLLDDLTMLALRAGVPPRA